MYISIEVLLSLLFVFSVLRMNLLISEIEKLQRDLTGKTGDSRGIHTCLSSVVKEYIRFYKRDSFRLLFCLCCFCVSPELEYELESKIEELEKLEKQLGLRNRMDSKKSMFCQVTIVLKEYLKSLYCMLKYNSVYILVTTIMTTIINNGKIAMAQTNEQYLAQIDGKPFICI